MTNTPMSRLHGERGVSLVELLVVMLLTGIIGTAVVTSVVSVIRSNQALDAVRTDMDDTRIVLDRMRRELRESHRVFPDPTGHHLQVWIDRNGDGLTTADEIVNYRFVPLDDSDRARMERWTGPDDATAVTMTSSLIDTGDPTFTYEPAPPATSRIGIDLHVNARDTRPEPYTLTAEIRLRNVARTGP